MMIFIKTEISCHGELFTASGKNVLQYGWKEVEERFFKSYGKNAENPEEEESDFPDIKMGQVFESVAQEVIAISRYGKITDFLKAREKLLMKQLSGSC